MNQAQVHVRDNNFFSEKYPIRPNPYFEWVWDRELTDSYVTVFTDNFLNEVDRCHSKYKVAILFEPLAINNFIYDYIKQYYNKFDLVLTFEQSMLLNDKIKCYYYGTTWIHEGERFVYDKNKMVSMIVSSKKNTYGQALRHKVIDTFKSKIDVMGSGYKGIQDKVEGMKDYRYHIAIENSRSNFYFTEKILDCFMTGAIPIYWGCPDIFKFFNPEGMYIFENINELESILNGISENDYNNRLNAIQDNFVRAQDYIIFEKYLWENGLSNFFKNI